MHIKSHLSLFRFSILSLPVSDEDVPGNLIAYLLRDRICPCGKRFVRSPMNVVIEEFDVRRIASTVTGACRLPVAVRLCSRTCVANRFTFA